MSKKQDTPSSKYHDDQFYINWYNHQFKPAVEKAVKEGTFSRYIGDKLLKPYSRWEREE